MLPRAISTDIVSVGERAVRRVVRGDADDALVDEVDGGEVEALARNHLRRDEDERLELLHQRHEGGVGDVAEEAAADGEPAVGRHRQLRRERRREVLEHVQVVERGRRAEKVLVVLHDACAQVGWDRLEHEVVLDGDELAASELLLRVHRREGLVE